MPKYFICGKSYFVENEAKKLISANEDFEVEKYFGDELNRDDFFTFTNTPSMFGAEKIAYVRNADKIKDLAAFIETTRRCVEANIILTSTESRSDLDKKFKGLSTLLTSLNYKQITELTGRNQTATKEEMIDIFKSKGVTINQTTALEIIEMTSPDLMLAENEAEKFAIYLSTNKGAKVSELMENLSGHKLDSIYDLIDRFAEKKPSQCLKILENIPLTDDKIKYSIFYGLAKRMTSIYFAFVSPLLVNEYQDFIKRKVNENKRFWKRSEAARMVEKFAVWDFEIKTGKITFDDAILNALTIIKS